MGRNKTHRADRVIIHFIQFYSTLFYNILSKLSCSNIFQPHHTPLPPQRQYLLRQHRLPTQRTLGLLPDPILDAAPAEDVAAGRDAGVAERFETERAFALLAGGDPG